MLAESSFQERKEVWGHPAPLPPFSSKQPSPADNGAVPPGARGLQPHVHPKHEIPLVSSPIKAGCEAGADATRLLHGMQSSITYPQCPICTPVLLTGGNWESLRLLLGCEGAREGAHGCGAALAQGRNPSAGLNWDVAGQGGDGDLLLLHTWALSHHFSLDTVLEAPGSPIILVGPAAAPGQDLCPCRHPAT